MWPCTLLSSGSEDIIVFRTDPAADAEWRLVLDLSDWMVFPVEAASPMMLRTRFGDSPSDAIHLRVSGACQSVVCACALTGFRGVTDYFLERLIVQLGARPTSGEEPPTIVLGRVELLLKHLLPERTPDEIGELLARRVQPAHAPAGSHAMGLLAGASAISSLEDIMESGDKKSAMDHAAAVEECKLLEIKLLEFMKAKGYPIPQSLAHPAVARLRAGQCRRHRQGLQAGDQRGGALATRQRETIFTIRRRRSVTTLRCTAPTAPLPGILPTVCTVCPPPPLACGAMGWRHRTLRAAGSHIVCTVGMGTPQLPDQGALPFRVCDLARQPASRITGFPN